MDKQYTIKQKIDKLKFEEEYYRQMECKGELTKCLKSLYWRDITIELKTLEDVWERLQKI